MKEHTPGPWMTDGVVVWDSTGDVPICVMTSRQGGGLVHPAENAPLCGLGNADLTAAAPALLEVARIALQFAPCVSIRSWPPGFQMQRDLIAKAKAAIAKAEGK